LLRPQEKNGSRPALSDVMARHLLARLRRIDPSEVRRALASSLFVAPLADGALVANKTVLPVGDTLVPFFQELVG